MPQRDTDSEPFRPLSEITWYEAGDLACSRSKSKQQHLEATQSLCCLLLYSLPLNSRPNTLDKADVQCVQDIEQTSETAKATLSPASVREQVKVAMSSNRIIQSGQYGPSLDNQHELSHIESYNEGQAYDNFTFASELSGRKKNALTMTRIIQGGQMTASWTHTITPTTIINMSMSAVQPLVLTPEAMAAEGREVGV